MTIQQFNLDDRGPITRTTEITKTATAPKIEVQLLDKTKPVNLSSATVVFNMDDENGVNKINAAAGILESPGTAGKVSYQMVTVDVDTEGTFFGQFVVTNGTDIFLIPDNTRERLRIIIGPKVN